MPTQVDTPGRRDDVMTAHLPPGALGLLLVFWGYASSNLGVSVLLCGLVEGAKFAPYRWHLSAKQFQNVADLSSVLFAVVVIYQFVQYAFHGIYGILSLIPVCIFPLVFAQRISTHSLFPLSALFLSLRRRIALGDASERWVSTEFIYALSCLLASSVNELAEDLYAYLVILGIAGLLFFVRSPNVPPGRWAMAATAVAALSIGYQQGVQQLYKQAESTMSYWFSQFTWAHASPSKEKTAIGQLGRLKLSDRIVIRVKAPLSIPLPLYLHEASYSKFHLGSWSAPGNEPTALDPLPSADRWQLRDFGNVAGETIEITTRHRNDVSVQVLPLGSGLIASEEIIEVQRNSLGTVMLEAIPGQLRYQVSFDTNFNSLNDPWLAAPSAVDLAIPAGYQQAIDALVQKLQLNLRPHRAALQSVSDYFRKNFKYSLVQQNDYPGKKPLIKFLEDDRSGHCEYFATATALLLRGAGIPTRYAVGYVVDEYSPLEKAFVARARHAHSWVMVYVDKRWQKFDTTPGQWLALEDANTSAWQHLNDLIAWVSLHVKRLQRLERTAFNKQIIWLVPILAVVLMWRLRKQIKPRDGDERTAVSRNKQTDSTDLNAVVEMLEKAGYPAANGHSIAEILQRHFADHTGLPALSRLIYLHYLKRYSMHGLSVAEQSELDAGVSIYRRAIEQTS
ncbi:MAG: transglutaminase-like domain-containing protein [Gammaproteobacteria bacterium]